MQIIQSTEYDIQSLISDEKIIINGAQSLTRNQLVSRVIQEMSKKDNRLIGSKDDPFGDVYISESNPNIFIFKKLNGGEKVLVLPAVVPLANYRNFVNSMYSLGNANFAAIAFSTGSTVQVLNDFVPNSNKVKCNSYIHSISANTIEIAIDLGQSVVGKLLDHIVKQLGYDAITSLFPNLSGIQFLADFSVLTRNEYCKSKFGNLVS